MTDPEQIRWLRPHEVASLWSVDRSSVRRFAERLGVRMLQLPTETRYHGADVERAYREMRGETW